MGFEYRFKITDQHAGVLGNQVDGINSLDLVLRDAPHFIGEAEGVYSYSDDSKNPDRWPSSVSLAEGGFVLCLTLRDSADTELLNYLMTSLLQRCGGLNVEDA